MVIESLFEALLNFLYLVCDKLPVVSFASQTAVLQNGITKACEFLGEINYFIPLNVVYALFQLEIFIFGLKMALSVFGFIKKYIPIA